MAHNRVTVSIVVVVFAAASVIVAQRAFHIGWYIAQPQASTLHAIRIKPSGHPSAEIECPSSGFVDFTYEVSNTGKRPIVGLKIGTKCSCEAIGNPPKMIAPGESANIGFRLRAPYAGKMQRKIPLTSDGASEPLAMLEVTLRVNFKPPGLIPPLDGLSLRFVHGDDSPHELLLEAIEAKREPPWIRGIELHPAEAVKVQWVRVEELPEPDTDLTRRHYHFPIVNQSAPIGRQMLTATIVTGEDSPPVRDAFSVWLDVVDSVAIVPSPLVMKHAKGSPPPSRQVRVVNRTCKKVIVRPVEFNEAVLSVQAARGRQDGSTAAFDVAAVDMPASAVETQVVFQIGDDETRALVVRVEPIEKAPIEAATP